MANFIGIKNIELNNHLCIGDTVYLIHDPEQLPRFITGIIIRPNDFMYEVVSGKELSNHYRIELSKDKTIY